MYKYLHVSIFNKMICILVLPYCSLSQFPYAARHKYRRHRLQCAVPSTQDSQPQSDKIRQQMSHFTVPGVTALCSARRPPLPIACAGTSGAGTLGHAHLVRQHGSVNAVIPWQRGVPLLPARWGPAAPPPPRPRPRPAPAPGPDWAQLSKTRTGLGVGGADTVGPHL